MEISHSLTDPAVLAEIGARLRRHRLRHNQTQRQLADAAAVAKRTVERLEAGESTQLSSFLRVCRALGLLDRFEDLVPEPLPSPVEQLQRQGRERQRASGRTDEEPGPSEPWRWGDE